MLFNVVSYHCKDGDCCLKQHSGKLHTKKLLKFQKSQKQQKKTNNSLGFIRNKTIHNFSLNDFSKDEQDA